MTHEFHRSWLKFTAILVASFGPVFFLATMEATTEPARFTLDFLGWPLDGSSTYEAPDTRFLSALAGGFLLGWGVMIWCLVNRVYDLAPEPVRQSVLLGLLAWFFLDSAGSIAAGHASNVGFNLIFLLLAVGPLWRPARDQRQGDSVKAPLDAPETPQ